MKTFLLLALSVSLSFAQFENVQIGASCSQTKKVLQNSDRSVVSQDCQRLQIANTSFFGMQYAGDLKFESDLLKSFVLIQKQSYPEAQLLTQVKANLQVLQAHWGIPQKAITAQALKDKIPQTSEKEVLEIAQWTRGSELYKFYAIKSGDLWNISLSGARVDGLLLKR